MRDRWKALLLPDTILPTDVEHSDLGACAIACGILRLSKGQLPPLSDGNAYGPSWDYYLKAWRPGKPDQKRWPTSYAQAVGCCTAIA